MDTSLAPSLGTLRSRAVGAAALLVTLALWGAVPLAPTVAAEVPPTLLAGLRYLVHGVASALILWRVGPPTDATTWLRAGRHAATGFVGYYGLLSTAVRVGSTTLVVLVLAVSPVVYTLAGRPDVRPRRLVLPMAAIVVGGVLATADGPLGTIGLGRTLGSAALTAAAVTVWTWYGLDNARVVSDGSVDLTRWTATTGVAAGLLSLPLVAFGMTRVGPGGDVIDGAVVGIVLTLGLACTTLANRCWNAASRRLGPTTVGPLLVLETVFGLAYAHAWEGVAPSGATLLGEGLLLCGAALALVAVHGARPSPTPPSPTPRGQRVRSRRPGRR